MNRVCSSTESRGKPLLLHLKGVLPSACKRKRNLVHSNIGLPYSRAVKLNFQRLLQTWTFPDAWRKSQGNFSIWVASPYRIRRHWADRISEQDAIAKATTARGASTNPLRKTDMKATSWVRQTLILSPLDNQNLVPWNQFDRDGHQTAGPVATRTSTNQKWVCQEKFKESSALKKRRWHLQAPGDQIALPLIKHKKCSL